MLLKSLNKFEEGLRKTIDWYLENKDWVDHLREKAKEANAHIKK